MVARPLGVSNIAADCVSVKVRKPHALAWLVGENVVTWNILTAFEYEDFLE